MKTFIICLIVVGSTAMSGQEKPQIIYVFDPLCGWCYGFSPVIKKAYDTYKEKADFTVITGGMVIGDQIGPIGKISQFLKGATARVTQRTGAVFSSLFLDTILTEGTQILSSMEPSIAVQICKQKQPDRLFEFISALHTDIYVHGLKTAIAKDYGRLAEKMDFDKKNFINDMQSKKYKILAEEDIQNGIALNIDSYPAVVMRYKGDSRVISQGFVDWEELSKKISNAIKQ